MDRTSIIILVVCFLLLMLWYPLVVNKMYPPKPLPPGATNTLATTQTTTNAGTSAPPAMSAEAPTPRPVANTNVAEQLLVLTNSDVRYTFSSHGGGLKLVELLRYPQTVSSRRKRQPETNQVATLNLFTPAPTLALLDGEAVQGDGVFQLTTTSNGVRAEKTLSNGLTIVKTFEPSTNYLVSATIRLENHATSALTVPAQEWVLGTATPMGAADDGSGVGVLWYNGSSATDIGTASHFSPHGFMCTPRTPPLEYRGGATNVFWAATHNQFFALALMPTNPADSLIIRRLDLPRPTGEEAKFVSTTGPPPQGYEATLVYPGFTLTTNQSVERQVYLYAGPKEYQTLARIADRFNNNIDQLMGFGRFFGFVSKALLLMMNWLHEALKFSYGWAIVSITLLIKLVFWPLTAANTRSTKRMQALQPQAAAIREKYKDDPLKAHQKTMELWKKHNVSPMGSCIPMLIQIPVFFGFLSMIRSAIELRGAPFLWVGDLSRPDTLFIIPWTLLGMIPVIGIAGVGLPFNLLPLIMGATMLWQARLTPPSPGMDATQQAIMKYLPLFFLVGLYNFSAGLTLYWTVNNILTIAQTKLTRTGDPLAMAPAPAKAPLLTPPAKKRK